MSPAEKKLRKLCRENPYSANQWGIFEVLRELDQIREALRYERELFRCHTDVDKNPIPPEITPEIARIIQKVCGKEK